MGAESKLVFTPVAEKVNQEKNLSVKGLCGSARSFLYAQCAQGDVYGYSHGFVLGKAFFCFYYFLFP
jgi:hypothetical protein